VRRAKKTLIALSALALVAGPGAAPAQVNIDAYREYFLIGQFGEVCTMCEVIVLCEESDIPPEYAIVPENASFTLYHLQTRTFWSQVSTIWEWFVANFSSQSLAESGHTRPAHVYSVSAGQWSPMQIVEVRLVLEPGVLKFHETMVDRVNRRWLDADTQQPLGYCQRLPLWESLEAITRYSVEATGQ